MSIISGLFGIASESFDIIKARKAYDPILNTNQNITAHKSPGNAILSDPVVWMMADANYVEKPYALNYSMLKYLAKRDVLIAAIINTRIKQMLSFSQAKSAEETQRHSNKGFRVKLKDHSQKKQTHNVLKKENELTKFIANCGSLVDDKVERNFHVFMRKFLYDRLTLDQACFERRFDNKQDLLEFYAIDGGSVRRLSPKIYKYTDSRYVQVYDNQVISKFTEDELAFCPENVVTDLGQNGYGLSEIELAQRPIMTHLGIEATNERMFHPGSMPKGLLLAKNAELSDKQMQILEKRWRAQIANMRGKHKIPFLNLPKGGELQYVNFPQPTEMEFKAFSDYVINVVCALYSIDPAEINFPNRGGSEKALFSNTNDVARLTQSKDKGLLPLMSWFELCMNEEILPYIDDSGEFEFTFVGYDAKTSEEKQSLLTQQIKSFRTVNEIREEYGLDPLEGADIILDSVYMQAQAQQQQQEEQPMEGQEGMSEEVETEGEEEQEEYDTEGF